MCPPKFESERDGPCRHCGMERIHAKNCPFSLDPEPERDGPCPYCHGEKIHANDCPYNRPDPYGPLRAIPDRMSKMEEVKKEAVQPKNYLRISPGFDLQKPVPNVIQELLAEGAMVFLDQGTEPGVGPYETRRWWALHIIAPTRDLTVRMRTFESILTWCDQVGIPCPVRFNMEALAK